MSVAMDKELMALSLDEEDEPFDMPNLPQFRSCERNSRSLIGRILNPDCQKMSKLIHDMPRKWQKQGKVRGVALSKERFQFIFDHEHDLLEVLEKGVHTFNEWALVIERWVENPPEDYLQFIPIWVQIRNIPVNFYTEEAIMALGERIGKVTVVAFDPEKPQAQDYVRIQVKFDVSRPLRKSMVVNLPEGGSTVVKFNYERVQKRCFECQRLNHAKEVCPLLAKIRKDSALASRQRVVQEKLLAEVFLGPEDPLFGVLSEDQVGVCPKTGRRKISLEVLEEMRRYILMATEADKMVRIARIKSSVAEAEKDPLAQKTVLRLESPPVFTTDVDKGKGRVFDLDLNVAAELNVGPSGGEGKLMASAIKDYRAGGLSLSGRDLCSFQKLPSQGQWSTAAIMEGLSTSSSSAPVKGGDVPSRFGSDSTEYGLGLSEPKSSGVDLKTTKSRRRPYIRKRQETKDSRSDVLQDLYGPGGSGSSVGSKRKVPSDDLEALKTGRKKEARVIPNEGSPKL